MKIVKIIFEDGSENEFKELSKEDFGVSDNDPYYKLYNFKNQFKTWEEKHILSNLKTDLEYWAKEEFDLKHESEFESGIDSFSDFDLELEIDSRGLTFNKMPIDNIINCNFFERIYELSRRGCDLEIDEILEVLEKKHRIK